MLDLTAAYEAHASYIRRYCIARVGPDAGEDVAAQVWLEACTHACEWEERGWPVTAWLIRIAQSRCTDHLRREARRPTSELGEWIGAPDALGLIEARADVTAAISRVRTPPQRAALVLAACEMGPTEIGAVLHISPAAAKALLLRARQQVRL